jgi:Rod binding domain-containing protein
MRIDPSMIGHGMELAKAAEPRLLALKKATQSFEAVFLKKLFSTMREGVKHVSLGQSMGDDMFKDMFDQSLADDASKTGNYGIATTLYKSFAPKVVAMEELRLRAEAASAAKTNSKPAGEADRKTQSDAELQHRPTSIDSTPNDR